MKPSSPGTRHLPLASSFDPAEKMRQVFGRFEMLMAEVGSLVPQIEWCREQMEKEFQAFRDERARLEMFTEAEAAAVLKIPDWKLAELRKAHKLDHVSFSNKSVMYTRPQIDAVVELFTVGGGKGRQSAVGRGQLKKVA